MTTRKEQKAQREEEILIAALNLFVIKGYAYTKTSDISHALNISEGLLFHYFKSKEALLETLVDIASSANNSWIDNNNMNPIEYFESIADSVLRCLKEDETGSKFFILVSQLKQNEGIPSHIRDKVLPRDTDVEKITAIVKKGQDMGLIRQGNPFAISYLFSNLLQSIAVDHALHPDIPLPETEWIVDMLRNHTKNQK